MMSSHQVSLFCSYTALGFYTLCYLPQMKKNFDLKSVKGLSDSMLALLLNSYIVMLYYVFLLDLPISYKIFIPIHAVSVLVWIAQRVYYDRSRQGNIAGLLYLLNLVLGVALLPLASYIPHQMGHIAGWLNMLFGSVSMLPQIYKNFREKDASGLSMGFVVSNCFAGTFEFVGAQVGGLPLQTSITALRCAATNLVFLLQARIYAR